MLTSLLSTFLVYYQQIASGQVASTGVALMHYVHKFSEKVNIPFVVLIHI